MKRSGLVSWLSCYTSSPDIVTDSWLDNLLYLIPPVEDPLGQDVHDVQQDVPRGGLP